MHLALQDLSSACPNPRLHTGQNLRLSLSPTTSCSKLSYCSCTNFPRPKRTPSIFAASVNRPRAPHVAHRVQSAMEYTPSPCRRRVRGIFSHASSLFTSNVVSNVGTLPSTDPATPSSTTLLNSELSFHLNIRRRGTGMTSVWVFEYCAASCAVHHDGSVVSLLTSGPHLHNVTSKIFIEDDRGRHFLS